LFARTTVSFTLPIPYLWHNRHACRGTWYYSVSLFTARVLKVETMATAEKQMSLDSLKNMQVMIANFCRLEDGSLLQDVNLRQYGFDSGELVSNVTVQELCTVHPSLRSLDLTYCKQVTDVGLWAIARHTKALQKLILRGCEKISTVGVRNISLTCKFLTILDLSSCYLVDDLTLTTIAGGAWPIQELYLSDCDRVTDNGVCRIADGLGQTLRILDLKNCTNVGEFGDRAMRAIGAKCGKLTDLIMTEARRVEDSAFIAISNNCFQLTNLAIAGCDNITKKGFCALLGAATPTSPYCPLRRLRIIGCQKVTDEDFMFLYKSPLVASLTSLELNHFKLLTDKGIAAICKTLGKTLLNLDISNCPGITDYTAVIIGNLCTKLRAIDYSYCGHISDDTVHTLARNLTCLTSLKLDGNKRVSTRAIISHVGVELDFVEMATQWLGYQPKPAVETLIAKKEEHVMQTKQAIMIQAALRRKFASRIYWERYRSRLLNVVIPLFQARVRGMIQRKRFAVVMFNRKKDKKAIVIQAKWRKYFALHDRLRKVKLKRYLAMRYQLALKIQKIYRGHVGRRRAHLLRIETANVALVKTKKQALLETRSIVIQRVFRGFAGRKVASDREVAHQKWLALQALRDWSARFIQRIMHGKRGRLRAQRRRWEIAHATLLWNSARHLQRVYRGHQGRLRYEHFRQLHIHLMRTKAAINLQRAYRGYRGRLLSAVARALRLLRAKQQFYAVEIQRTMRGCVGRHHFKVHKELETRRRRKVAAAQLVQRVFRGHKGREARQIEYELQLLDSQARPLILQLKHLEEAAQKLGKQIHRMEDVEARMSENLFQIEREYNQCQYTTSKYSDSARINNTPQRFLTKFLIVRLKDLLEHETVRNTFSPFCPVLSTCPNMRTYSASPCAEYVS
jgi:hypothetical protein